MLAVLRWSRRSALFTALTLSPIAKPVLVITRWTILIGQCVTDFRHPVMLYIRRCLSLLVRGAYLVQGQGHCGSCHTPRSWTMKEKAYWENSRDFLAGGQVIDGCLAINLRSDDAEGLGRCHQLILLTRCAAVATMNMPYSGTA